MEDREGGGGERKYYNMFHEQGGLEFTHPHDAKTERAYARNEDSNNEPDLLL